MSRVGCLLLPASLMRARCLCPSAGPRRPCRSRAPAQQQQEANQRNLKPEQAAALAETTEAELLALARPEIERCMEMDTLTKQQHSRLVLEPSVEQLLTQRLPASFRARLARVKQAWSTGLPTEQSPAKRSKGNSDCGGGGSQGNVDAATAKSSRCQVKERPYCTIEDN